MTLVNIVVRNLLLYYTIQCEYIDCCHGNSPRVMIQQDRMHVLSKS